MAKSTRVPKPFFGPPVSRSIFEARWLAKFNAILDSIKFGAKYMAFARFDHQDCIQTFNLIIAFVQEARELGLEEGDFNTDPLPFEFVMDSGLHPIRHLNPFEAAEHYSETMEGIAVARRDIRQDREKTLAGWQSISNEEIADVHKLNAGIAKAKEDGLWPRERMARRRQIVEEKEFSKWKALDKAGAMAALKKD